MNQFIKRNNRRRFILKDKDIRNIDVVLLLVMIGLALFGILNIYLHPHCLTTHSSYILYKQIFSNLKFFLGRPLFFF